MKVVVMAGGSGTRLWLLSRAMYPASNFVIGRRQNHAASHAGSLYRPHLLHPVVICKDHPLHRGRTAAHRQNHSQHHSGSPWAKTPPQPLPWLRCTR